MDNNVVFCEVGKCFAVLEMSATLLSAYYFRDIVVVDYS